MSAPKARHGGEAGISGNLQLRKHCLNITQALKENIRFMCGKLVRQQRDTDATDESQEEEARHERRDMRLLLEVETDCTE